MQCDTERQYSLLLECSIKASIARKAKIKAEREAAERSPVAEIVAAAEAAALDVAEAQTRLPLTLTLTLSHTIWPVWH